MELKDPRITILITQECTTIKVRETGSNTNFLELKLSPEQLSMALSGLGHTHCSGEVHGLDKIGKIHECRDFVFKIPEGLKGSENSEKLHDIALREIAISEDAIWVPDKYYGSQNSFPVINGIQHARTIIRRWA